ncbi:MAG: Rieske 2Fe-2S domain-containing protein [Aphanothece sp. CMT-3BRIN-NPC111]|jgi:hypothetical protein|nr:Rieske 2Fe-2S domain-containing protein [Aphanothece sp. CMT-3BRIN-NPC111]
MELATNLTSQTVQNSVREVGINPNYWYPVGWASELKRGDVMPAIIWLCAIALYRDTNGQLHALEDACPHKGVALTLPISVQYRYPHYYTSLQGISSLYLMRLPVGAVESRSFAFFFFKVRLPKWLLMPLKPLLVIIIQRFVLLKFLAQDIGMIESEQQTYLANKQRRYVEINSAIVALQRAIVRQYEQFMQKSSQTQPNRNRNGEMFVSLSEVSASGLAKSTKENSIG